VISPSAADRNEIGIIKVKEPVQFLRGRGQDETSIGNYSLIGEELHRHPTDATSHRRRPTAWEEP